MYESLELTSRSRQGPPPLGLPGLCSILRPALCILALAIVGCGGDKPKEPIFARPAEKGPPPPGQGVFGFNEPLTFEKGIGVRAVSDGKRLAVSVRNATEQELVLLPAQFRILHEHQQYALEVGRDDLSGFPPTKVAPGDKALVGMGIARLNDLKGLVLVYNNPAAGVRFPVPIE